MTPDGSYHYGVYSKDSYQGESMMLPATWLIHKKYLEAFNDPNVLPRQLFDYINEIMNCDDIVMNFLVSKFLRAINMPQPSIIKVQHKGRIINMAGAKGKINNTFM